jgi:hypothetical protein
MRPSHLILITAALSFALVGCEGDQGPAGPAGPAGPSGSSSEFTFAGKQGAPCQHCHLGVVETWTATGHAGATESLSPEQQDNPYCMQCHTTGWDRTFTFGQDFDAVAAGPDVNGYDDYFRGTSDEAIARRADLAGVQCESCHGAMGPDFNAHRPQVSFSTHDDPVTNESTSLCAKCHGAQLTEWKTSGHANVVGGDIALFNEEHYTHNPSCDGCHTSEGFIRDNDPRFANYVFPEEQSFIGCVTCHDPHAGAEGGGNVSQLRNVGAVQVAYHPGIPDGEEGIPELAGKGAGQTCAQCHHARRNEANVNGQIANGSSHFGPHSSPQMDTYIGYGSYEIPGYTYNGRYDLSGAAGAHSHYSSISNACVRCHMAPSPESAGSPHALHNFNPNLEQGCGCHGATEAEALLASLRTDIEGKMDAVSVLLGFTDYLDFETNIDSTNQGWTPAEREAAYAVQFLLSDGSMGAHNPKYARSLLDNAQDYLESQIGK